MNLLIFCSFEVGGFPYKMAEILNKYGFRTFYISLHDNPDGHDSAKYHYGENNHDWDLTSSFRYCNGDEGKIINTLKQINSVYKFSNCLATGYYSYLLRRSGIKYIYWCFGADLDQIAFYPFWPENYSKYKIMKKYLLYVISSTLCRVHFNQKAIDYIIKKNNIWQKAILMRISQRKTLRYSESVMIAPYQYESYIKICNGKKMFFFPHFYPISSFEFLISNKSIIKKRICDMIAAEDYFFSSTRHMWVGINKNLSDYKGNEILISAFAKYLSCDKKRNIKLLLVKKGFDVKHSERLAEDLGISDKIFWIDEMKRDELNEYYLGARLCFGQFGTPVLTNTCLEPLVFATPCISFFKDGKAEGISFYKELPPVFNSKNPEKISNYIFKIVNDEIYYQSLIVESYNWISNNCSEEKFAASLSKILYQ